MISGLLKSKKRVIFIKDNPDIDFNVRNCFIIRPFRISSSQRRECSISSQHFRERVATYNAVIDEILSDFPSVEVQDTRSFFCKDGRCNASDDQLPYYADSNHLTTYGANKVFEDMLKKEFFDRLQFYRRLTPCQENNREIVCSRQAFYFQKAFLILFGNNN